MIGQFKVRIKNRKAIPSNVLARTVGGKHRLPAIYSQKEFVDEGRLMFYGADSR